QTVTDLPPTALQLLFLQGTDITTPIDYTVTALQDGKRFSSRHVRATQGERTICDAHVTFQKAGPGLELEQPLGLEVPEPEELRTLSELGEAYARGNGGRRLCFNEKPCLRLCVVDPEKHLYEAGSEPRLAFWVKLRQPL